MLGHSLSFVRYSSRFMSPETVAAIQSALAPAFATIGEGGKYAWEITVKAQYAEGIAMLSISALLFIAWVIGIKLLIGAWKKTEDYDRMPIVMGFVFSTVLLFVVGGGMLYDGLFHVLAPEFKALEFFIGTVKGGE